MSSTVHAGLVIPDPTASNSCWKQEVPLPNGSISIPPFVSDSVVAESRIHVNRVRSGGNAFAEDTDANRGVGHWTQMGEP
jgi:hypothetical protein